jgi:ABC-type polysaccharide/polyol phosphate export permease
MSGEQSTQQDPRRITARQILGKWPVWVFPSVLVTLVSFVLSLVYTGGIADPQGSMRHLPIALINHDTGPWGKQFVQAVATAPDPGRRVSWRIMSPAAAKDAFDSGRVYGGIDVPRDFSSSLQAIIATPARAAAATGVRHPQVTLLTNPGAGSLASSLATGVEQQALRVSSQKVGADLKAQLRATGAQPTPAQLMLLGNPIASTTAPGHRIGARTGLGLTAFYLTLLVVLSGFLGANIVSNSVDAALGYAPSELGPKRRMRSPLLINRTQTLVIKMVMSAALSMVTSSAIVLATAVIIRLDLPHLLQLWVFAVCASAVVGISAQTIVAAFGGLGQVISMFFFVALSIPSAGATVPLEALPGFYRVLALFEPMRQIGGGTRAIIYFDARADAGLQRAWIMLGVGLAVALVLGFGITRFYDKRGYHRVHPDHIQSPRS